VSKEQQTLNLTVEDLNKLIGTAVNSAVTTALSEARKPAPEHNKGGYEEVIFALQEAGLPTGTATIYSSLEEGLKKGVITIDDRDLALAYLSAHRKEVTDFEQAMAERAATAKSVIEKKQNERYVQEHVCTHEHLASAGGGSHCVHVHDNGVLGSVGYVLCQKCQGRVRPDEPLMRKLDPEAIFNTQLFNRLLQSCLQTGQEMMA
jgi:hypothetical protein